MAASCLKSLGHSVMSWTSSPFLDLRKVALYATMSWTMGILKVHVHAVMAACCLESLGYYAYVLDFSSRHIKTPYAGYVCVRALGDQVHY